MSISPKYESMFRSECDKLTCVILDSIQNLKERPNDTVQIKRLVQAADTMWVTQGFLKIKYLRVMLLRLSRNLLTYLMHEKRLIS